MTSLVTFPSPALTTCCLLPIAAVTCTLVADNNMGSQLWVYNEPNRRWQEEKPLVGHDKGINVVAFAPNIGRYVHILPIIGASKCLLFDCYDLRLPVHISVPLASGRITCWRQGRRIRA